VACEGVAAVADRDRVERPLGARFEGERVAVAPLSLAVGIHELKLPPFAAVVDLHLDFLSTWRDVTAVELAREEEELAELDAPSALVLTVATWVVVLEPAICCRSLTWASFTAVPVGVVSRPVSVRGECFSGRVKDFASPAVALSTAASVQGAPLQAPRSGAMGAGVVSAGVGGEDSVVAGWFWIWIVLSKTVALFPAASSMPTSTTSGPSAMLLVGISTRTAVSAGQGRLVWKRSAPS